MEKKDHISYDEMMNNMQNYSPSYKPEISVEDLMKSRYKVIADYPNRDEFFELNEIITFDGFDGEEWIQKDNVCEGYYEQYPNIFRKLEWWEERSIDDMPEYVKVSVDHMEHYGTKKDDIIKVSWCYGAGSTSENIILIPFWTAMIKTWFAPYSIPSTEQEYNEYINQQKLKQHE